MEEAKKDFEGKPDLYLLQQDFSLAFEELARAATFGANKYGRGNWKLHKELEEKYVSAALRHIARFARGQGYDAESQQHHLAHAAWSLLAVLERELEETPTHTQQ